MFRDTFHDDPEVQFESYYTKSGRRVIVCPECAAPRSKMHVNQYGNLVCDACHDHGIYTSFTLIIWDEVEEADEVNEARRAKVMLARKEQRKKTAS